VAELSDLDLALVVAGLMGFGKTAPPKKQPQ
jgi:hypothetical protein